jgi:hypothetical protein
VTLRKGPIGHSVQRRTTQIVVSLLKSREKRNEFLFTGRVHENKALTLKVCPKNRHPFYVAVCSVNWNSAPQQPACLKNSTNGSENQSETNPTTYKQDTLLPYSGAR